MATVIPPIIERPKKSGHCGEIINDLDVNMAKQYYYDNAPKIYGIHTDQIQVIPNPLNPRPPIDKDHPMSILQSNRTDKHILSTQQSIHTDVRIHLQAKLKTIIEMFPPGSICKIYLDDMGTVQAVIHRIEFSTTHLDPALYIEFFKLKDVLALPAETSLDTLSQYPIMQSCVIYNPEQIEIIDSSDAAEMSRELIKNEMLAIKKQIAALKDNLRRLSRLKNSRGSTSGIVGEIDRKYHALARSLEQKRFMK